MLEKQIPNHADIGKNITLIYTIYTYIKNIKVYP